MFSRSADETCLVVCCVEHSVLKWSSLSVSALLYYAKVPALYCLSSDSKRVCAVHCMNAV